MIPKVNTEWQSQTSPTYTYRLNKNSIGDFCDGQQAMAQAIYKALSTSRYDYVIYSRNYGIEIKDLFGKPMNYVCAVIKGRIEDALYTDSRIEQLYDFVMTKGQNSLLVEFKARTIFGTVEIEKAFMEG